MNSSDIKENWDEQKKKLKEKIAALTDNNFLLLDEKTEEIIIKLESKLGKTKEEIYKIIATL
ncbi:MAG: hypothetical protein V4572_12970 [Bacteroidota bacterium]